MAHRENGKQESIAGRSMFSNGIGGPEKVSGTFLILEGRIDNSIQATSTEKSMQ